MKTKKPGFTLIELLVAVTISGIILTAVMTSYGALLRNKQRLDIYREVQSQTTLSLSRIADKVRDYGIDYAAYSGGSASDETTLHVGPFGGDPGEEKTATFAFENDNLIMNLGSETAPLFGEKVTVNGRFRITPERLPEAGPVLYQPKVHITLEVASTRDPSVSFSAQTTISSRRYR